MGKPSSLNRKPYILSAVLFVLAFSFILTACGQKKPVTLTEDKNTGSIVLYYFWGDGCSHCAEAKPWLEKLEQTYPELNLRAYEIWYSETNQGLFTRMADAYNVPQGGRGTPTFFLDNQYWVGYSDAIGKQIEAAVAACAGSNCADAGTGIMPGAADKSASSGSDTAAPAAAEDTIDLPLIGKVDLAGQSLFISTLLISFVDGFNPCSIWVLTMLLALTLHTGSRKKIIIIGLIFLTVTAGVYALFIAGLFTVFTFVSFIGWIQVVVALLALFFAAVNIKDYFWYKEGISFTIADDKKPGIYQRIRKVMDASQSFWGLAGATVIMSAGVSLVEFTCTAGFPVLWTNILASQKVTTGVFILLLLVYLIIYQLDEMVLFFTAVFSMKATRMEEKHGRILKLISGMLMLTLAVVMLVNPSWLNSLSKSLLVFAAAFGLTGLVLLLHRRLLPAAGIYIGTEYQPGKLKGNKRRK
jgi:thiol-disulfide isomerase/thioredoxin